MAAKQLTWPKWISRLSGFAGLPIGPLLDALQERQEIPPHIGWVVKAGSSYYVTTRWRLLAANGGRVWSDNPAQARLYQSRAAALTSATKIRSGSGGYFDFAPQDCDVYPVLFVEGVKAEE